MQKIILGLTAVVLSLGLSMSTYAAEEAVAAEATKEAAAAPAADAKAATAADAPAMVVTMTDGKCMATPKDADKAVVVTVSKSETEGKFDVKGEDGAVVTTVDSLDVVAEECKPKE